MELDDNRLGWRPDLSAAAGVGIVSLDADGYITTANAAAANLVYCHETDLIGLSAHEAFSSERKPGPAGLMAATRSHEPAAMDEDSFRRPDGSLLPVWWVTNPLRDPISNDVVGSVLVFGDATGRRAQSVTDAADRAQRRSELAAARRTVGDLKWTAEITQALSATLDERELLSRLARLVVSHFGGIALSYRISSSGAAELVGRVVADSEDDDLDALVQGAEFDAPFKAGSKTFSALSSAKIVHLGSDYSDATLVSEPSRRLLNAVGASDTLIVPLLARGHVVGALVLVRIDDDAPFAEIDQLVAADICQRAALALDNARLYRAQTDISTRLQRALLPELPTGTPVQAAVRYLPARDRFDVGGDWYDLYRTSADSDTTVLVVGDVAGHDLAAGTTMSALRNLLRSVTVVTSQSPAEVLAIVDGNLGTLGITGTATAVLMTVTPRPNDTWELVWSNAGHMPPVFLLPDGSAEMAHEVHGPLLGTGAALRRTQTRRDVPAGTTIVLYTDGLVETRHESIDVGLARLRRTAMSLQAPIDDLDAVADELLTRNHASSEDDTAMLVCHLPTRPTPTEEVHR